MKTHSVRLFLRPNYDDYDKSNNTDDNDINSRLSRWAVFDNNDVYLLGLGRRGGLGDEWEGKGQQQLVTAGCDHNGDDQHGRNIYCCRHLENARKKILTWHIYHWLNQVQWNLISFSFKCLTGQSPIQLRPTHQI